MPSHTYRHTTELAIGDEDREVVLTLDIEDETYMAEPYSWGEGRGTERDVLVTIKEAVVDGQTFERAHFLMFLDRHGNDFWKLQDSLAEMFCDFPERFERI